MKRFISITAILLLLALVCVGVVGFNLFRDSAIKQYFATMKPPATTVSTVVVKPSDWTPGVEAIGTVRAVRGVDLTVETSGIVKDILFHANQKVPVDSVLLQLDDAVERADLEATKAQVTVVQTALERAIELQKRGVNPEATLDTARATAAATEAQVAKLQAVLDQKQLTAPFSGTVGIPKIDASSRLVSVRGEVANPDGKLTPGQFVQVRVELPQEKNILSLPQTALTSSLYGDFVFVVVPAPAEAGAAPPAKAEDQKPAADKPADDAAKPQAEAAKPAADAAKSTDKAAEKPAPADAGKPAADEEKPALVLSQVFVKPGRRNDGMVEIIEGIKAGDEVVTAGQNRLFNGMSVAVDNTIDPSKSANQQAQQ